MELNSGPKIANSTCGKTIDVETIDRDSTVYNFYNYTNQQFVTIPGTSFPDATDKPLVTSLSNNFMLLQINCLSQFQAQTNYSSPGWVRILCCYKSTACHNPRHQFAQHYRQFACHQSEH